MIVNRKEPKILLIGLLFCTIFLAQHTIPAESEHHFRPEQFDTGRTRGMAESIGSD